MAAACSMDMRTRVLKDSDAGLSSKALAERYHVSRAWVDALKQRRRETGAIAALKPTKFQGRRVGGRRGRAIGGAGRRPVTASSPPLSLSTRRPNLGTTSDTAAIGSLYSC